MNHQPHDHIVRSHDEEQNRLRGELLRMGAMAVAQLEAALDVVERRDDRAAQRVIDNDIAIDQLEHETSQDVVKLSLRGPLARDLRQILAALRIASDIERIGDYATNVARRSMTLNLSAPVPLVGSLGPMSRMACRLVRDAMRAYAAQDANLAYAVWERDADLDALYTTLFRELLTYMMEDPRSITACTHLLFIAKNIERIGDHATNIAENIWFVVRGETLNEPRARRDLTSDP